MVYRTWEEVRDKYNQYEETDYDYTITFYETGLKGWPWEAKGEPKSVSYEMLPITQADGTVVKRWQKYYSMIITHYVLQSL